MNRKETERGRAGEISKKSFKPTATKKKAQRIEWRNEKRWRYKEITENFWKNIVQTKKDSQCKIKKIYSDIYNSEEKTIKDKEVEITMKK